MGKRRQGGPVVRIAPLGEIRAWIVYEHELDALASGSPGAILLNFALALLPIALTLFTTLLTVPIEQDRVFYTFVCLTAITFIAGVICLVLWIRDRHSAKVLMNEIKNRMPPPEGIQEPAPETP